MTPGWPQGIYPAVRVRTGQPRARRASSPTQAAQFPKAGRQAKGKKDKGPERSAPTKDFAFPACGLEGQVQGFALRASGQRSGRRLGRMRVACSHTPGQPILTLTLRLSLTPGCIPRGQPGVRFCTPGGGTELITGVICGCTFRLKLWPNLF